jgi:hypothetical protein
MTHLWWAFDGGEQSRNSNSSCLSLPEILRGVSAFNCFVRSKKKTGQKSTPICDVYLSKDRNGSNNVLFSVGDAVTDSCSFSAYLVFEF